MNLTSDTYQSPGLTKYDVLAIRYASGRSNTRNFYQSYESYGRQDRSMGMDYFFWMAVSSDRIILIDTGFDPVVAPRRSMATELRVFLNAKEALARFGLKPSQVSDVIVTHFHYDHIGNLGTFGDSRIVVSSRELDFWTGPYGQHPAVSAGMEFDEVVAIQRAQADGRVHASRDYESGIPGIRLIDLSGHTPGQIGVGILTDAGETILASDAAHYYEEYEDAIPGRTFVDLEGMLVGFSKLREFSDKPGSLVVPGHDPSVMDRFSAPSNDLEGIAVRLTSDD
jgi:glyoxylase-like metal-dependent hydrolase (beta-lactamase superfamily II)